MIRITLTMIAVAIAAIATPAKADTADVWCFTQQTGQEPTETKKCGFSQSGGNVSVYRGSIEYRFTSKQQGKFYTRTNGYGGIVFQSPKACCVCFGNSHATNGTAVLATVELDQRLIPFSAQKR